MSFGAAGRAVERPRFAVGARGVRGRGPVGRASAEPTAAADRRGVSGFRKSQPGMPRRPLSFVFGGGGLRVSFSTDMAKLVADQLSRFVTLNRHQLAGQVANLDFWLAQVRHALAVIEGYGSRFVRMHAAQEQYVTQHGTTEF